MFPCRRGRGILIYNLIPKGGLAPPFDNPPVIGPFSFRDSSLTQGFKGVLVPSGHRPGPTEPAGETGVPLEILLYVKN